MTAQCRSKVRLSFIIYAPDSKVVSYGGGESGGVRGGGVSSRFNKKITKVTEVTEVLNHGGN